MYIKITLKRNKTIHTNTIKNNFKYKHLSIKQLRTFNVPNASTVNAFRHTNNPPTFIYNKI